MSPKPNGCNPCDWPECGCQGNVQQRKGEPAQVERMPRAAIIEECAAVCDKHAKWAEDKIEDDPKSQRSQIFAGISNTANDCAEMIRDLKASAFIKGER